MFHEIWYSVSYLEKNKLFNKKCKGLIQYICVRMEVSIVIVVGNGHGDTSSKLNETDCISHSTNTLGKGMNPIILAPAMAK